MLSGASSEKVLAARDFARKATGAEPRALSLKGLRLHDTGQLLRLSFSVIVLLPTLVAAIHYLLIAAPRYVAVANFAIWTATPPHADPLTMLMQMPTSSASLEDQRITQDYISARPMLEAMEKQFDLNRIYGTGGDFFSELWPGQSIEDRVRYWKRRAHVTIDSTSGISTLEVDAFRPEDALALANAVLAETQTMVQSLSDNIQADAVRQTRLQFEASATRLSDVRARVTAFRRENHMVDATHTGQLTSQMIGGLETSLADAEAQIQQLRSFLAPNDPRISVLRARADSLRRQIDVQKTGLSESAPAGRSSGPDVLPASVLAKAEVLETELDVALKSYAAASPAYFEAQGNLTRNRRYLEVFVKPALPERAMKPQRWRMIATVLLSSFIAWCLFITVGGAIRDHAGV